MDSLIEKYGIKKVLIVIAVTFSILFLILFLIKRSNESDKKLFECSNTFNFDVLDFNNVIKLYKNDTGLKLKMIYNLDYKKDFSNKSDEYIEESAKTILDNIIKVSLSNSQEYIKSSYKVKDKKIEFYVDIDVNEESQYAVYADFNYDIYNLATDELINKFEEGGYKCSK